MATRGGARALGLEDRIGSLAPGRQADVITVSVTGARQTPLFDPVSHLVYVARGSDVRTTIVAGRVLMRDGRVRSLDRERVLTEARAAAVAVRNAVGK
jgi:5-methylthioadenosine/S-adenosylhomocysteine deaminase